MFLKQFHIYNIFANGFQKLRVVTSTIQCIICEVENRQKWPKKKKIRRDDNFFFSLCLFVYIELLYLPLLVRNQWQKKKYQLQHQRKRMDKSKTNRWKAEIVHFISVMQFVSIELVELLQPCVADSFHFIFLLLLLLVGSLSAEQYFHVVNAVFGS